jgi:transcriptional regulator with XRE-family HTH domain
MQPSDSTHHQLGAKLRALRTQRGLSVRTLAAQVGFSPSFISQIEGEAASPSIASLEKIAAALGVTLGQLFSSIEHSAAARTVIRRAERASYTSSWSHSTVAVLADAAPERSLSAVELLMEPGGASSRTPQARTHDTFAVLTEGTLTLILETGETPMSPGDSAYLPAGMAFAWTNQGETPATLLLVGSSGRSDLVRDVLALSGSSALPGDSLL